MLHVTTLNLTKKAAIALLDEAVAAGITNFLALKGGIFCIFSTLYPFAYIALDYDITRTLVLDQS